MDIITYLLAKGYTDNKLKEIVLEAGGQSDWREEDMSSPSYIKNKPNKDDALILLAEMGFIKPTLVNEKTIFTDSNDNPFIF